MGSSFTDGLDVGLDFPLGNIRNTPDGTGNDDLDTHLGVDMVYVGPEGGLQVEKTGDYRLITGYENVRRSIMRRLLTAPGEYALDPSYGVGIGDFVKKKMTGTVLDTLKSRIRDQISADRRVTRVTTLDVTPSVDQNARPYLRVNIEYEVVGRKVAPLSQNFYGRN